jgi:dynein regulatory complex protein 1
MKWSELKEEEECEKLYQAIQEQKSTFKNIVDGKERLIDQFTDELKKKDDDYVKMLKEESQDIKQLVSRMRSQFFTLRDENLKELEEIQRKFEAEVHYNLILAKNIY